MHDWITVLVVASSEICEAVIHGGSLGVLTVAFMALSHGSLNCLFYSLLPDVLFGVLNALSRCVTTKRS